MGKTEVISTRIELVQLVQVLSDRLAEATDLEDEKRIMRQIFRHARLYRRLSRGSVNHAEGGR